MPDPLDPDWYIETQFMYAQNPNHLARTGQLQLVLSSLLVHIGLAVVSLLLELITDSIAGCLNTGGEASIAVLCDGLVGLVRGGATGTLDALRDVVGGVPIGRVSC